MYIFILFSGPTVLSPLVRASDQAGDTDRAPAGCWTIICAVYRPWMYRNSRKQKLCWKYFKTKSLNFFVYILGGSEKSV